MMPDQTGMGHFQGASGWSAGDPHMKDLTGKKNTAPAKSISSQARGAAGGTIATVLPGNISGNNQTEPLSDLKR